MKATARLRALLVEDYGGIHSSENEGKIKQELIAMGVTFDAVIEAPTRIQVAESEVAMILREMASKVAAGHMDGLEFLWKGDNVSVGQVLKQKINRIMITTTLENVDADAD